MSARVSMSRLFSSACSGAMYSSVPTMLADFGEQRAFGQLLAGGLGDAEIDHLGHRLAIVQSDQHVGRLQIAMDDALLMCVLHGLADGNEQFEPFPRRQMFLIAKLGDRDAFDQLHDEIGAAAVGRAGVKNLGDIRMIHDGQRLPFGLEAGDDLRRVHARLDDLDGNHAADRLFLFGQEDDAHAAFAELLKQFVGADACAGRLGRNAQVRAAWSSINGEFQGRGRLFQETVGGGVRLNHGFDLLAQGFVGAACLGEESLSLARRR